jgi:hypothetical protein
MRILILAALAALLFSTPARAEADSSEINDWYCQHAAEVFKRTICTKPFLACAKKYQECLDGDQFCTVHNGDIEYCMTKILGMKLK